MRTSATLHALSPIREWDPPARPALPDLARPCPDLRVKPTRFQAYSSRPGTLEGNRLAKHKLPQTTAQGVPRATPKSHIIPKKAPRLRQPLIVESLKRTISDPTRISVSDCGITQKGAKKCYLTRSFPYKRVGSTGAPGLEEGASAVTASYRGITKKDDF